MIGNLMVGGGAVVTFASFMPETMLPGVLPPGTHSTGMMLLGGLMMGAGAAIEIAEGGAGEKKGGGTPTPAAKKR